MSEEKLYAVRDNEGKYWDFSVKVNGFLSFSNVDVPVTIDKDLASEVARNSGGHVVTLIEEPEKVVLSKEQAEIVEHARDSNYPADCVSAYSGFGASGEQKLLIEAYVNGYTVAKEKKHLVYKELGGKQSELNEKKFAQAYRSLIYPGTISWILTNEVKSGSWAQFTESEIEQYGLQDCEKEEVADDGMGC
ncbi:DUF1642 domain-containing protein [Lacticaseibacillus paracasei]|uniref:DUF1642 domain-containing protein n=1 Tax=Lacticaseibacillus paracasei TaxID=1597 RepID=UPI0026049F16|nr:DUF1642 domain-containing protein [Lacticaseibacillus paracasei]MDN4554650.1 DUF1642 domain-containing protein [Lacticaseibacillus paracasei]